MKTTYSICIVLFLLGIAGIGMYLARKVKSHEDWAVAGHSLGVLPCVGTLFATFTSAVSVMSYIGYYYLQGWSGWWTWMGMGITILLSTIFYSAKLRRIGKTTLPEYIEERFGAKQATLCSVITLFAMVFMTSSNIIGGAIIFNNATGLDYTLCLVLISVLFILFTMYGGMVSVAWTDTICAGMMLIGVSITAIILMSKVGGFSELNFQLYAKDPNLLEAFPNGVFPVLSLLGTWAFGNFGVPHFVTRAYIAKDERTARLAQGWAGIALLVFNIPCGLIGLAGILLLPGIEAQDQVTILLMNNLVPPVVGGMTMAAVLAAAISTADSVLLMAGTTATNDIYKRYINKDASPEKLLKLSRLVTLVIGIIATIAALFLSGSIMWVQAYCVTILGSAMAAPVLIGLAWKRANAKGGLAGSVCGLLTAIGWYVAGQPFGIMPMMPAFIVSCTAMVVVSLATEKPPKAVVEHFFPENPVID